jgi:hypothetical protein
MEEYLSISKRYGADARLLDSFLTGVSCNFGASNSRGGKPEEEKGNRVAVLLPTFVGKLPNGIPFR